MPSYLAGFIYAGLPSKSLSSLRSTLQMFDPWDQFRYSSSNIHTTAEPSYYKQLTARVHYGYSPPKQHDYPIQIMNKQTQQSRGTSGQLTAKLPPFFLSLFADGRKICWTFLLPPPRVSVSRPIRGFVELGAAYALQMSSQDLFCFKRTNLICQG